MKRFQTISEISNASEDELAALPEIPMDVARRIAAFFTQLREKNGS